VGALVALDAVSRTSLVPSDYVPPVSNVLSQLGADASGVEFWTWVWETLQAWALGMLIAVAVAIPLGLIIGSNRFAYRSVRPVVDFLRPIPPVAFLPLFVLLYGVGLQSKMLLVAFGATWPMLVQTMYGVHDVDPLVRDSARVFGYGRVSTFSRVVLPSAMPYIATGLRVVANIALIITISMELLVGSLGLGAAIVNAQNAGDVTAMYALVATTGFLGLAIGTLFARAEQRLLRWHPSQWQRDR
jgi:ABC-type nitrate/sulfonate/bicarbonate transport system permease component